MKRAETNEYGFLRSESGTPTHFFKHIGPVEADAITTYRARYDALAEKGRAPRIHRLNQNDESTFTLVMDVFPGYSLDRIPPQQRNMIYTPHFAKDMALLMEELHAVVLDPTDDNPGNFFYDPHTGKTAVVLDQVLPALEAEEQTLEYFVHKYARTMLGLFLKREPEILLTEMAASDYQKLLRLMPKTAAAYDAYSRDEAQDSMYSIIEFCHEPLTTLLSRKNNLQKIDPHVLEFSLDGLTTRKKPQDFSRIYQLAE